MIAVVPPTARLIPRGEGCRTHLAALMISALCAQRHR